MAGAEYFATSSFLWCRNCAREFTATGPMGTYPSRSRLISVSPISVSSMSALLTRRRPFDLGVDGLGHLVQSLLARLAVDHIGDVAVRPVECADLAVDIVAQCAVRPAGARAVEREALAGRALVHEEGGGAARARQQPAADELQADRREIGDAQLIADALGEPLGEMRLLAARHLDRMTHLDDVELVGVDRLRGGGGGRVRPRRRHIVRGPSGGAADHEGGDRRRGRHAEPWAVGALDL